VKPDKDADKPSHFPRLQASLPVGGKGLTATVLRGRWDDDGGAEIDHDRWMIAVAMGDVGSCRKCGKTLIAETPIRNSDGTYDYEARCSDTWAGFHDKPADTRFVSGCPGMVVAPKGRVLRGSSAYRERARKLTRD
jgi:hypothetical protein